MKHLTCILWLSIIISTPVYAIKNYSSNILSPIPPGCATNFQTWVGFNASGVENIFTGTYPATNILDASEQDMQIRIWRKGCPNSNRAVIMMDLSPVDDNDGQMDCLVTPMIDGVLPNGVTKHMRGTAEPHTNFQFENLRLVCEVNSFTWFVDTMSLFDARYESNKVMTPIEYNNGWKIVLDDVLTGRWSIDIPAYSGNLSTSRVAFTGRLSGNWAVSGVPDQGFLISFNELTDVTAGVLFVSWYTYDNSGNLLWLTGNVNYEWGDTEASFDIQLVENGVFMGSKVADRRPIGTARIVALDCNSLQLTYDLSELGLGSATKMLVRIFSLEIQGYACTDLQTRFLHENDF